MSENHSILEPSLPLKGISIEELRVALLVNGSTEESLEDSLLKLENYICNFSKDMLLPLANISEFSEESLDGLMNTLSVISPLTLMMFFGSENQRIDEAGQVPFHKKEARLLEMFPDRFRARYKRNIADRHSRELTEDESDASDSGTEFEEYKTDKRAFGRAVDILFSVNKPTFVSAFLSGRSQHV